MTPAVWVACLVLALVAPVAPAVAAERGSAGSSGIGDRYFPLDGNSGIDVQRYRIRVAYDFASGRLTGRTRLRIKATQRLTRFHLDLLLPVQSVRVNGVAARFSKPHRHELRIVPRKAIGAGTRFTVEVRYAGRPARLQYAGERNWLADRHEVVTMNQPHMAPWWFPANDHPSDRAHMDISVTVPRGKTVIANGTRVGRTVHGARATTRWRAEPMAPYLAFFAAGPYAVQRGRHQGRPWLSAVSRQIGQPDRRRMMRLMNRTPRIVAWTERLLGRYPFATTGGLTTGLPVDFALENQTRPTYPVLRGADAVATVVHEVAHQWFGNSVTVHRWRDIWLNEGAARYLEVRWAEEKEGYSGKQWLLDTLAAYAEVAPFWRVRVDDPGADRIFHSAVYLRGAMTFQALRQRIGSPDFDRLLRAWVQRRAGRTGTTAQFIALAEEISGEDLTGFFHAWLRSPGVPARTPENGFGSR